MLSADKRNCIVLVFGVMEKPPCISSIFIGTDFQKTLDLVGFFQKWHWQTEASCWERCARRSLHRCFPDMPIFLVFRWGWLWKHIHRKSTIMPTSRDSSVWCCKVRWPESKGTLALYSQMMEQKRCSSCQEAIPKATASKILAFGNSREDSMFPKKLRSSYVYSAAFWLVTRGRPGPNISRNERTHWQVAKASMARRRLGWESAEASATSLLQLPSLMDGTFCCKALRWSTMKKPAVLVQIIFFPKLPKAGIGGKTKGVRSQCFTDTRCEELETFRRVFPRRASRDSRREAWGDDCIHRASIAWGFPCGFVT